MHIPSYRVQEEMINEEMSLWYVPANDKQETAMLLKAPTPSLKALILGCPFRLIFGKKDNYFCIGAIITDVPDAPILILKVQRELEEQEALQRILKEGTTLYLFNEMDLCVAWARISFSQQDAKKTQDFIGDFTQLYVGPFTEEVTEALDCLEATEESIFQHTEGPTIPRIEILPAIGEWTTIEHYFYGSNAYQQLQINDPKEGKSLEETVWISLSSVFPQTLYKNAVVKNGEKKREFTDVFAFYEQGSFLFETKALSVFASGFERTKARRISGIQKQVKKAMGQLVGAYKDFSEGKEIESVEGMPIMVERTSPPHCIVLIQELPPFGNWDEIVALLMGAMEETHAFFHLLDLPELITLLKASYGNPYALDGNLMQRAKLFWDTKSVFIKSQVSHEK